MADEWTDRHALPLLQAGQAQKELTHNEALVMIDALAMAAADAIIATPPGSPAPGACWIVGPAPSGAWADAADMLAVWTPNGWRFLAPREGMRVWLIAEACDAIYHDGAWSVGATRTQAVIVGGEQVLGARQPAVAAPTGGTTIDVEARAAIAAITARLAGHGLVASA